jgi:hypothetical protein
LAGCGAGVSAQHVSFLVHHKPRKEGIAMPKEKAKVKPVHEIRLGRIKAAVWENETQNGSMHNVTFSRLYKVGTQWKDSGSFGRDDLPLLAKVADRVHSWIFDQSHEQNGSQNQEQDGSSKEDF